MGQSNFQGIYIMLVRMAHAANNAVTNILSLPSAILEEIALYATEDGLINGFGLTCRRLFLSTRRIPNRSVLCRNGNFSMENNERKYEADGYSQSGIDSSTPNVFKYKEVTQTMTKLLLNPGEILDDVYETAWRNSTPCILQLRKVFSMNIPLVIERKHCKDIDDVQALSVQFTPTKSTELRNVIKSLELMEPPYAEQVTGNAKFGYIKIEGEPIPFVTINSKKYLPKFYFDSPDDWSCNTLNINGDNVEYVKFLCKLQNIRKELYDTNEIEALSHDEVMSQLRPGTFVQSYWPTRNRSLPSLNLPIIVIKHNSS